MILKNIQGEKLLTYVIADGFGTIQIRLTLTLIKLLSVKSNLKPNSISTINLINSTGSSL